VFAVSAVAAVVVVVEATGRMVRRNEMGTVDIAVSTVRVVSSGTEVEVTVRDGDSCIVPGGEALTCFTQIDLHFNLDFVVNVDEVEL
jgi:hypothetical protein